MTTLACVVVEKSMTKNARVGQKDGGTEGRTDKCNPVYPQFFKAGYNYGPDTIPILEYTHTLTHMDRINSICHSAV